MQTGVNRRFRPKLETLSREYLNNAVRVLHEVKENTTDLAYRDGGIILVAQKVIDKPRAWVAVASDRDTLVHAVGVTGDDIVQLVRHTPALGDVCHRSWSVQLHSARIDLHERRLVGPSSPCQ